MNGVKSDSSDRALTGAYVLSALPADEEAAFERLLESREDLRAEVESLREVLPELAELTATPPPESLRASIMSAAARESDVGKIAKASDAPEAAQNSKARQTEEVAERSGSFPAPESSVASLDEHRERRALSRGARTARVVGIAASAALVIGLGTSTYVEHQRADEAQQFVAQMSDLASSDGATLAGSTSNGMKFTAILGKQHSMLLASDIPDAPEGRSYQLWTINNDKPTSSGVVTVKDGQLRAETRGDAEALAITVEQKGGSPTGKPTTDPIIVLT